MSRALGARLVTGLMLGTMLLGAGVAPVAAVSHTRWVDNNSQSGGPAACASAHFHTIQAAINAANPGDEINVCPGVYREQLTIDTPHLTVRSWPTRSAKIVPPQLLDEVDGMTALVRMTARDDAFVGFKLIFQDESPVAIQQQPCSQVDGAIVADGPHARVFSNTIKTTGDLTFAGDCGYLTGIILGSETLNGSGDFATGPFNGDTSLVAHNRVVDFKYIGIGVGGDRSARVYGNDVRYIHANDPSTCVITPVLGIQAGVGAPGLTYPCALPSLNIPAQLEPLPFSVGIGVAGALVDLKKNTVYSTVDVESCDFFFSEFCSNALGVGIGMIDPAPGSRVRNNTVTNTFFGVGALQEFISAPPVKAGVQLPAAPDGVAFTGNRVNENVLGFFLLGDDNVFYGNRAHLNMVNMYMFEGSNNTFSHNDFRYNIGVGEYADCVDESSGAADYGTANWWGDPSTNWGYDSYPSGICTAPYLY